MIRWENPSSAPYASASRGAGERGLLALRERRSTNERGSLRIDQLLTQGFGREADPVRNIGEFQLGKQVTQRRLVKSHRVLGPCREIFSRFALTITPWLFTSAIRR